MRFSVDIKENKKNTRMSKTIETVQYVSVRTTQKFDNGLQYLFVLLQDVCVALDVHNISFYFLFILFGFLMF